MKPYFLLVLILAATKLNAAESVDGSDKIVVRPLGYLESRRPPSGARRIVLQGPSIKFAAKQVCGYTDWSTAAITLPKEILSTKYWRRFAENLADQAVDTALSISGALPSMLACNASATFCHVMNNAEALAQTNLAITMESCSILEGIGDQSGLQSEPLRRCVQAKVAKGMRPTDAREECIIGSSGDLSQSAEERIANANKDGKDTGHKASDLNKVVCGHRANPRYIFSPHAYSVTEYGCRYLDTFFPGISVEAEAVVQHGGTFQPRAERIYRDDLKDATGYVVELLTLMHEIRYGMGGFAARGPEPRHKVVTHAEVQKFLGIDPETGRLKAICPKKKLNDAAEDPENTTCRVDVTKIPPIYRLSSEGADPVLLIDPGILLEIVDSLGSGTSPRTAYYATPSRLALVLEPILQSTAAVRTQSILDDLAWQLTHACESPQFSGAAAQADCKSRLETLQTEKVSLTQRREDDQKHVIAQMQTYQQIGMLRDRRHIYNLDPATDQGFDTLTQPSEVR